WASSPVKDALAAVSERSDRCGSPGRRPGSLARAGRYRGAAFVLARAGVDAADVQLLPDSLRPAISVRGGASSSHENAAQKVLKSLLASPSLPSLVKSAIEAICRFVESLTGWSVLPWPEKKRAKAKKKGRPREEGDRKKEVLVEKAASGASRGRSRRSSSRGDLDEVERAVETKTKKRKKPKAKSVSSDSEEVEATTILEASEEEAEKAEVSTIGASKTAPPKKPKRPDAASQKFLANKMKSSNPNYRIQRELKEFLSSPPPGLSVKISGKNVRLWVITLSMPTDTVYAGETYRLRVQFPPDYPTSPPSVYFLPPTPRHEHVYTNGDICLSLLGKDWRPIMTAQSIAQAIMSILCGAQRKGLPMDNARHAGNRPGQKQDDWVYHDDNC
ncbi:hypothetical protein ACHAWF_003899, partial [Thalassiosira exigua]